MSGGDGLDPGQKEHSKPVQWIIRIWQEPPAPHWAGATFTLVLALFALLAWRESTKTTQALQGQLDVLKAEQRPFVFQADAIGGSVTGQPAFSPTTQIVWNFAFANFGHTVAYNLSFDSYIKVGKNETFQPSASPLPTVPHTDLPPGAVKWGTVFSRQGFNQEYFDTVIMKQDGAIQIRVEFHYFDASHAEQYTSAFCLSRSANGVVAQLSPVECQ